jgi:hypothetical protein
MLPMVGFGWQTLALLLDFLKMPLGAIFMFPPIFFHTCIYFKC